MKIYKITRASEYLGVSINTLKTLANNGRGHLDHKTPLVKGGLHEISNLVFACSTCNLRKATKTAEEYLDIISR